MLFVCGLTVAACARVWSVVMILINCQLSGRHSTAPTVACTSHVCSVLLMAIGQVELCLIQLASPCYVSTL